MSSLFIVISVVCVSIYSILFLLVTCIVFILITCIVFILFINFSYCALFLFLIKPYLYVV